MKKLKRSAQTGGNDAIFVISPPYVYSFNDFCRAVQSAKSSISEDLAIIKEVFEEEGLGELHTLGRCSRWCEIYS